ncbi:MAG: blue light receptor [Pycnora praestabilis]|nr:MAG: blue light receptor [Pycnora praestabilis]
MSMFDPGANGLPSGLSADISRLAGGDRTMTDMLEQDGGMMNGLDLDMMPVSMDLNLNDPDPQTYTPMTPQANIHQLTNEQSDALNMSNNTMTGAGAGPLPTGFGATASVNGGSTLTEFTKRRNWSQRVLEELKDFLHILTPDGRILYVSPSGKSLTGYDQDELVGKFIVDFIHPDDSGTFVREFNESIASGHPLRFFYRFRKEDGTYTIFESHGHPHLTSEAAAFGPNNAAGFCRGFFMMARPYPTKNANLLDSFLEHKIENERLTKRIAELKKEEQEEAENQQRHWLKKQEGLGSITPSETQQTESEAPGSTSLASVLSNDYNVMPPPAKPSTSNTALTRQNLEDANLSSKPDSINDKMARYEGATHIETIEMLTGLRYRDGERSQGISTGDASPALIRGDAGIAIPVDKESRAGGDKKKKMKVADEYVCTDCGTLDSPEWRKGPNGPKTLCNACGLRWAKKEKKRQHTSQQPPGLPMQVSTESG